MLTAPASLGVLLGMAFSLLAHTDAPAPKGGVLFVSPTKNFAIPFRVNPAAEKDVKEVRLYVSSDQGKSWSLVSGVNPTVGRIIFRAPSEGTFWFAVQTVKHDDSKEPLDERQLQSQLRVRVELKAEPHNKDNPAKPSRSTPSRSRNLV